MYDKSFKISFTTIIVTTSVSTEFSDNTFYLAVKHTLKQYTYIVVNLSLELFLMQIRWLFDKRMVLFVDVVID